MREQSINIINAQKSQKQNQTNPAFGLKYLRTEGLDSEILGLGIKRVTKFLKFDPSQEGIKAITTDRAKSLVQHLNDLLAKAKNTSRIYEVVDGKVALMERSVEADLPAVEKFIDSFNAMVKGDEMTLPKATMEVSARDVTLSHPDLEGIIIVEHSQGGMLDIKTIKKAKKLAVEKYQKFQDILAELRGIKAKGTNITVNYDTFLEPALFHCCVKSAQEFMANVPTDKNVALKIAPITSGQNSVLSLEREGIEVTKQVRNSEILADENKGKEIITEALTSLYKQIENLTPEQLAQGAFNKRTAQVAEALNPIKETSVDFTDKYFHRAVAKGNEGDELKEVIACLKKARTKYADFDGRLIFESRHNSDKTFIKSTKGDIEISTPISDFTEKGLTEAIENAIKFANELHTFVKDAEAKGIRVIDPSSLFKTPEELKTAVSIVDETMSGLKRREDYFVIISRKSSHTSHVSDYAFSIELKQKGTERKLEKHIYAIKDIQQEGKIREALQEMCDDFMLATKAQEARSQAKSLLALLEGKMI